MRRIIMIVAITLTILASCATPAPATPRGDTLVTETR